MKTRTIVVLNEFRYGDVVTIDTLAAATGIDRSKIFNVLCRLCAAKQIVRTKRGIYLKAANPPPLPSKMSGVWPAKPAKAPRVAKPPKSPVKTELVASTANIVQQAISARRPLEAAWGAR